MTQDNNIHDIDEPTVEPDNPAPAAVADPLEIQRQRDEYKDLLLRKSAEFDNYRKRVDRERQAVGDAAASGHDRRDPAAPRRSRPGVARRSPGPTPASRTAAGSS